MSTVGFSTYSFKDISGAFDHPAVGNFLFAGQIGAGHFTVGMSLERTVHDTAADGAVMISYIAGDPGYLDVEVQETSPFHAFLLNWFNTVKTAADQGDPTQWASATVTLRALLNGANHVLVGVSPSKIPDKPYASQGARVTWRLMAGNIQNS